MTPRSRCKDGYPIQALSEEERALRREYEAERDRKRRVTPRYKERHLAIQVLYRARHPERVRARDRLRYAVRTGKVVREDCAVCGMKPTQGHHHNGYDHPFDVTWLCSKHHGEMHRVV